MMYDTEKYKATLYNQLKQKINIVQKQITKHSKKNTAGNSTMQYDIVYHSNIIQYNTIHYSKVPILHNITRKYHTICNNNKK